MEQLVANRSGSVEAAWAWYEKRLGVVEWGFRNTDSSQRSVVLLRNSYYFGDAFWPVYAANPAFRTLFLDGSEPPPPLAERGVPQNSAPLAIIRFNPDDGDQFARSNVSLVISLSPGQAWGMLEAGFTQLGPPSGVAIYDVSPVSGGEYCMEYDPRAVRDWDEQTRTRLGGYTPNPSTFRTWVFQAEGGAPYRKLFAGDSITRGRCIEAPNPKEQQVQTETNRTPERSDVFFPPVFPDVLSPPLNP